MAYSRHPPVLIIGGRLALDFANTADWSAEGAVVHEKIETLTDAAIWAAALGLEEAPLPTTVDDLRDLRGHVRSAILGHAGAAAADRIATLRLAGPGDPVAVARRQPLTALVAASAIGILGDRRELSRVKMCPGHRCGWLFLDETRNARRRWCSMDSCGNRAKAARHYQRSKESGQ